MFLVFVWPSLLSKLRTGKDPKQEFQASFPALLAFFSKTSETTPTKDRTVVFFFFVFEPTKNKNRDTLFFSGSPVDPPQNPKKSQNDQAEAGDLPDCFIDAIRWEVPLGSDAAQAGGFPDRRAAVALLE